MLLVVVVKANCLDLEIEDMRLDGPERHDISIFIETSTEYIHSRIFLKPLITGIDHANKLSSMFTFSHNSTFSRVLNSRIKR